MTTGLPAGITEPQCTESQRPQQLLETSACLHELFEQQVERTPDAVALVWEGELLSYAQLNRRANWLAHHLRERGVIPDQLVGLHVERGLEMVVGIIGILKAGAAYLPLDPIYPSDRIAFMLEDSSVQIVVTQDILVADLDANSVERILLGKLDSGPDQNPAPLAKASNLAYVIYTSGSTGKPKGALISHYNVTRLFNATEHWYHFGEQDVWTLFHSYAFDFSVWELWGALLHGGRVVVVPFRISRSPEDFRELLVREGVTVLNQTPSAFRQLIQAELAQPKADIALRYVIFGGEALELQSLKPWFDRYGDDQPLLVNMYGITETTVHVTYRPICLADLRAGQGSVIGAPIPDLQLYILDPAREPVPAGVEGEIYVGGAGVARGYLNRPELTAERFIVDPFSAVCGAKLYRTGDLARRLENGDIEYLGRIDHQVKIRGFRIELGEIESVIAAHPAIAEVAVIVREDAPGDRRLVAYIVAANPPADLVEQLHQRLRADLPEYMVPAYFVSLGTLPLTENGKVDRRALPSPDRASPEATYVAPRTAAEETLAGIWAEVLGLKRVGIQDNFFELGGHSLLLLGVIQRMRQAGLHADVSSFFLEPTIAVVAAAAGESLEINVPPNLIPPGCSVISPDMLPLVQLSTDEIARVVAAVPGGVANIQDIYPLTPLQEGMLFHHHLAREGDPYLVTTVFGSHSRELLDRYIQALQLVIDRHDVLRTLFLWEGLSEPVQVVCRQAPLIVETLDLDPVNGDIAAQLEQRFDPRHYRLDVRQAPVIRIFIAHDAVNGRWVMLRIHQHLLEDHTTDELMSEEIFRCLQGQAKRLPPPLPFRDFVARVTQRASAEKHKAFFSNMLADVDKPTLPFGLTDLQGSAWEIREARSLVDSTLSRRLRDAAHKLGASAASIFHLAWAKVLSQCSGRDDVVFGTVLLGRMDAGPSAEQVLGPFINTLPLRMQLGDTSVVDGVRQTHTRMAQLLAHEHASLAVAQSCSAVVGPLFSALINFRHLQIRGEIAESANHAMAAAISRMGLELLKFEERTNYPLTLMVDDLGDGFRLEAQVQSPISPQRICNYMHAALEQLVGALESAPETPIRGLGVLPDTERHELLETLNNTQISYPREALMHEQFEAQVKLTPERTAVCFGAVKLTYAELDLRANRMAQALRSRGVGRGVRVGLCVERGTEMLEAVLGILKTGATYVPLDPSFPSERLRFMVEDAELALLVSTTRLAELFELPREMQLLLDADAAIIASAPATSLPGDANEALPEDPAYIIYTSGTTGKPKGVVLPHRAVVNFLTSMARQPGIAANDVLVAVTTLSFDIAVLELQLPLICGGMVVIASRDEATDGQVLKGLLEQHGATMMQATPVTWRLLLETEWACSAPFKGLVGGEALPKDLADALLERGVELWNMYGPTETTVWSTCTRVIDTSGGISIGKPIANTVVYVLDEQQNLCPVGVPGELYIGGDGVALGYWRRPELTADRFITNPFSGTPGASLYRTGDCARWRDDGLLEHIGRLDDQVKIRGFRVELGEIEAQIARHPEVHRAAVHLWAASADDVRIVACCVPTKAGSLATVKLRKHLRENLPPYMIPQHFLLVSEIPLTPNGKVDRRRLPTPAAEENNLGQFVAPIGPVESAIAEIWTELIKPARPISRTDRFFEMGGHSLLALQFLRKMEQKLSVKLDIQLLLRDRLEEIAIQVQSLCALRENTDDSIGPILME